MKNLSMISKVSFAVLLLIAVFTSFYLNHALSNAEQKVYHKLADKLIADLAQEEQYMSKIGLTNATLIAENKRIKHAMMKNDRNAAIDELDRIFNKFKENTQIKDLKIHIHTADVKSYIRNWKLDKYGDDLSGFRKTIVKVKETRRPVFSFEVGRIGLTLRSIVPILEGDQYFGSLEFIQAFDNVPKHFERRGNHHLLLMNDSLLSIGTDLKNAPSIDHYKLSSKYYNQDFFETVQTLDIDAVAQAGYLLTDQYLYTFQYIKDMTGNNVGVHLLGMPVGKVSDAIDMEKQTVWNFAKIFAVSFLLILILIFMLQRSRS